MTDAELDAIVVQLAQAGLVESYVNDEGKAAMRLTPNVHSGAVDGAGR